MSTKDQEVTIIPANNLSEEAMAELCGKINEAGEGKLVGTPTTFSFRKSKDDAGNVSQREPLVLALPYLTTEGLIAVIEAGGKPLELLLDAANSVIESEARGLINDIESLTADTLDLAKLDWEFIANKPKAQRGGGISKEQWEDFIADYCAVMPDATGKPLEKIQNMAAILKNKLAKVATHKPILEVVISQLAIYMEASEAASDHAMAVEFLVNKADKLLNADSEEALLEAL